MIKTVVLAVACAALASAAGAVTVPNGHFTAGNTGFTSDYVYGPAANELFTGPPEQGAGYYAVTTNANFNHTLFYSYGDHTTGNGQYLVANGATVAGQTVWRSATLAINPNTFYGFQAFFSNAYPASPADIDFRVSLDGGPAMSIGGAHPIATNGSWEAAARTFNSGSATSVVLSFVDLNTAAGGNDFGIDDITLGAIPEPATWAMLVAGFGLVGVAARRRRGALAA